MKTVNCYFKSVVEYMVPIVVDDEVDIDEAANMAMTIIEDAPDNEALNKYFYGDEPIYLEYAIEEQQL